MKILVSGGAGYIGSHMAKMLATKGHEVVVFDNLSTGNRWAVQWGEFVEGDLLEADKLTSLFSRSRFDAVMHFSALSLVGESVQRPELYWRNNVVGTMNLLDAMQGSGTNNLVFSSTAATFGLPRKDRIDENHPQAPINPYGQTKLAIERMLTDYSAAFGFNSVSLRYFNAAGADPDAEIGERHDPETHLVPNVLKSVAGKDTLRIFGNDYDTPDGTCVRDYIHVNDLCAAHLQAIDYMQVNKGAFGFNLGNGKGFSVLEIIESASEVTGVDIPYEIAARREGDPSVLVADSSLAQKELGWKCEYVDIGSIIETAWRWHQKNNC